MVRLTAPDGYRAQRSYSVASAPDDTGEIELTVERLDDGEVSTFLHDVVLVGDRLEVRGPIGGWFVWDGDTPAFLLGGGSGVVPLMSMLRLARATGTTQLVRLVVSVRTPAHLLYAPEIEGLQTTILYTRTAPKASMRPAGRLRPDDLAELVDDAATCFVCGSAGFATAASEALTQLGISPDRVRVERFGPTG